VSGLLLDTNVVSALRTPDRQDEPFQRWASQLDAGDCSISVFTWMELRTGVLKKIQTDPAQGKLLAGWLHAMHDQFAARTIPFDDGTAEIAASLWLLRLRGSIDTLIAATALAWGLTLVTRNISDFADVPGLTTVNPWE